MKTLIANELYKLVKKRKIFIFGIITIIVCGLQVFLSYKYDESKNLDWKGSAKAQIDYVNQLTESEEFDEKSEEYNELMNQRKYAEYVLTDNISSMYIRCYWAAVSDSMGVMVFVTILAVLICCEIFCEDYSLKTIKMIFIRPNKRRDIWLAKIITTIFVFVILSLTVMVTSCIFNCFLYDSGAPRQGMLYINDAGVVEYKSYILYIAQSWLCVIFEGVGYILVTALCAVLFKNASVTMTISLVLLLGANVVISIYEQKMEWIKYTLFYNSDLSQYLNNGITFWKTTFEFSLLIAMIHYIAFYAAGIQLYSKQEIY